MLLSFSGFSWRLERLFVDHSFTKHGCNQLDVGLHIEAWPFAFLSVWQSAALALGARPAQTVRKLEHAGDTTIICRFELSYRSMNVLI